ncbi:MAG: RNA pseudouridine synthase [Planctomycetes bacterium]|nr:RNA pseudouridine synthase [Planctomycetota bacterium]
MFEQVPPLEILLDDGPVLAVNKPSGLLTQGVPRVIPTLEAQVKAYIKERFHKPGNVYLGIPHRLDRPVSGVVVFARNSKAARRLAEQFQQRQVRKVYWGVVEKPPDPPEGTIADWLQKLPDQARAEVVTAGSASARECTLHYRTLATASGLALLEIEPATGRMHQIRLQLASRGWCLVGDSLYGARSALLAERLPDARAEPIALHARSLTFLHPIRYDAVTVTAPVPAIWQSLEVVPET